ncbi:MAG: glycosyltransferase family 4 protein [Cyanobacteria bacterium P01_A01_bin.84]
MYLENIAYISFDVFPSQKGAATHIAAFSQSLAQAFGKIYLVTVSSENIITESSYKIPSIIHIQLPAIGETLIHRILYFRRHLMEWLKDKRFASIHIRSAFEGFPIVLNKHKYCKKLIFEVNGLPSIELKYRYPAVADDKELLHKLYFQEQICLKTSDLIITPSPVTSEYLQTRDIPENKIKVIPNGLDLNKFTYRLPNQNRKKLVSYALANDSNYKMIYFGTLSSWQGVNLTIEALALINHDIAVTLTIIGHGKNYQIKALEKLAAKLKVTEKLTILNPLPQTELVEHIHSADIVLAPLTASDRNLIQGCCPLKVIESMGTGVPVIASDLPVVNHLGTNEEHFLLVKPGSAKSIKDAVLRLYADEDLAQNLAINARKQVEEKYTWEIATKALIDAYTELGIVRDNYFGF